MDIRDEHSLQEIKNKYGGSIKLKSGANTLRYRLHHKSGLLKLIKDVNGLIRNSNKLVQLSRIFDKYNLKLNYPAKLTFNSAWFSGFFESKGAIIETTYREIDKKDQNSISISVSLSQKTRELVQPLCEIFGGEINIDYSTCNSFKWSVSIQKDILNLIEYFSLRAKINPSRSYKIKRLYLILDYYELIDIKANKALPGTFLYKK
jgi:hypothetical protein